jgi:hypothetical protein
MKKSDPHAGERGGPDGIEKGNISAAFIIDPPAALQHPALTIITVLLAGRPDAYAAWLDGRLIHKASRQPFLEVARVLIAAGHDPATFVSMRHAGSNVDSLRSTIGTRGPKPFLAIMHGGGR